MPEFKIYLVDYTASTGFTSGKKALLTNRLKNLFESVVAGHTEYTIRVLWEYPTAILANELLCYYVLNPRKSLIKAKFRSGPGIYGYTYFREGQLGYEAISEVYYNPMADFPTNIADLTFHEFMHNKLDGHHTIYEVHQDRTGFGQESLNDSLSDVITDDPAL